MTAKILYIDGEAWVGLDTIAECYEVTTAWVVSIYDCGLLGRGRSVSGRLLVTTRMFDRVARVRQLNRYHGLDIDVIAALLGTDSPFDRG